jgi:hypothetical protein
MLAERSLVAPIHAYRSWEDRVGMPGGAPRQHLCPITRGGRVVALAPPVLPKLKRRRVPAYQHATWQHGESAISIFLMSAAGLGRLTR